MRDVAGSTIVEGANRCELQLDSLCDAAVRGLN